MKKDNRRHILFRYALIITCILLFAFAIVYKVFHTTVISADRWNAKAMRELSRTDTIAPERGDILASNGSILATNLRFYHVRLDYRSEKFMEANLRRCVDSLADSLALHFGRRTPEEWHEFLLKPLKTEKSKRPRSVTLLRNISYSDVMKLRTFPFFSIKNPNRNGFVQETTVRRVNPYGDMARRSVGRVGELANGEKHGVSGLEKALDSLLYGVPGVAKKIPLTRDIVNWTDIPPRHGYNIRTTIDINMQDILENELNNVLEYCNADWGVAVLMEVATGDIKAISNLERPKDGGPYIEGMNRAVLGFEPGSVVKTVSMMLAVEDGLVHNVDSVIPIGANFPYAGGRPITDSHFNASLKVREVIEQSSNIGMARIITRHYGSNPGAFYSRLKRLGFLDEMHTGIAGERAPRIDSVPSNRGGQIALSRMCYGYTTEIPPLSTLAIYNAIANGGKYVRPRLVKELLSEQGDSLLPVTYIRDRACSEKTAEVMREMLKAVVWGDHGTGRRLRDPRVPIAGKTGTCYIIENGGYNTSKKRLAFCGFFPADKPLYSCIVLTCYPKQNAFGAASTSGMVLKNVALKMYSRGMLDNHSDYREDATPGATYPTLYASVDPSRHERVKKHLGIGRMSRFNHTAKGTAGVPRVIGLGLRDAVAQLEAAGIDVSFRGHGYVTSQSITPGTPYRRGEKITLTLTE